MSAYRTYAKCPPYTIMTMIVDSQGRVRPADAPKGFPRWAHIASPPPVNTKVQVTMNGLGRGFVVGYFEEGGYLGLLVHLYDAPAWHRKQRNNDPIVHIFGPEFEVVR